MKILFDDKSYVELSRSINKDKIYLTIAAKNPEDLLSIIINTAELSLEQFKNLIDEILKELN